MVQPWAQDSSINNFFSYYRNASMVSLWGLARTQGLLPLLDITGNNFLSQSSCPYFWEEINNWNLLRFWDAELWWYVPFQFIWCQRSLTLSFSLSLFFIYRFDGDGCVFNILIQILGCPALSLFVYPWITTYYLPMLLLSFQCIVLFILEPEMGFYFG